MHQKQPPAKIAVFVFEDADESSALAKPRAKAEESPTIVPQRNLRMISIL